MNMKMGTNDFSRIATPDKPDTVPDTASDERPGATSNSQQQCWKALVRMDIYKGIASEMMVADEIAAEELQKRCQESDSAKLSTYGSQLLSLVKIPLVYGPNSTPTERLQQFGAEFLAVWAAWEQSPPTDFTGMKRAIAERVVAHLIYKITDFCGGLVDNEKFLLNWPAVEACRRMISWLCLSSMLHYSVDLMDPRIFSITSDFLLGVLPPVPPLEILNRVQYGLCFVQDDEALERASQMGLRIPYTQRAIVSSGTPTNNECLLTKEI